MALPTAYQKIKSQAKVKPPTKAVSSPSQKLSSPSFFSKEGQSQALKRVVNVLNPLANNPVYLGNTSIDVGAPVRTVVRAGEAALAVPAGIALTKFATGQTLRAPVVAAGTAAATGGNWLMNFISGGAGFILGKSLSEGKAAPQVQSSTQTTTTTTDARQTTKTIIYSPSSQDTRYNIYDSPGSYIEGSPTLRPSTSASVSPSQDIPYYISPSTAQSESQEGTPWLTLALVGVGAFLLARR